MKSESRSFLLKGIFLGIALFFIGYQLIDNFKTHEFSSYHQQLNTKISYLETLQSQDKPYNLIYGQVLFKMANALAGNADKYEPNRYLIFNLFALFLGLIALALAIIYTIKKLNINGLIVFLLLLGFTLPFWGLLIFNLTFSATLALLMAWLWLFPLAAKPGKNRYHLMVLALMASTLLASVSPIAPYLFVGIIGLAYFKKSELCYKKLAIIFSLSLLLASALFSEAKFLNPRAFLALFAYPFRIFSTNSDVIEQFSFSLYKISQLLYPGFAFLLVLAIIGFVKKNPFKMWTISIWIWFTTSLLSVIFFLFLGQKNSGFELQLSIWFVMLFLVSRGVLYFFETSFWQKYSIVICILFLALNALEIKAIFKSEIPKYHYANTLIYPYTQRFIKEKVDYNALLSFQFLKETVKSHNDSFIVCNFTGYYPGFAPNKFYHSGYSQRDEKNWKLGIFSRSQFNMFHKRSPSFPPSEVLETKSLDGVTIAVKAVHRDSITIAYQMLRDGAIGQVIPFFRRLTKKHPYNEGLYYGMARAQFYFGLWDDALHSTQIALTYNPGYEQALCLKGEIFHKQNKLDVAEEWLKKAIAANRKYDRSYCELADLYLKQGEVLAAKDWLDSTLSKKGFQYNRAKKLLRYLELSNGQADLGNDAISQATNIAETARSLNDPRIQTLKTELDTLSYLDSTNSKYYVAKGMLYLLEQSYITSIRLLDQAILVNPNYIDARNFLAIARVNHGVYLYQNDSLDGALFSFRVAYDYRPNDNNIRDNIVQTYCDLAEQKWREDEVEEALGNYSKALELNEASYEVYKGMGEMFIYQNNIKEAEKAFYRAHVFNPKDIEIIKALIAIYTEFDDQTKVYVYQSKLNSLTRNNKK